MQTVPTLVGTGTAVAAAASGLVFGEKPLEQASSTARRPSIDRSFSAPLEPSSSVRLHTSPSGRSGPNSATPSPGPDSSQPHVGAHVLSASRPPLSRHHRPASAQLASYKPPSRRQSFARQRDFSNPTIAENPRDSISSNSSWIRRLSVRPLSHHGSIQSSLDYDTTSIAFSHGSGAPILAPHSVGPQPLPPNKLVKRSSQHDDSDDLARQRSRLHRPTLRRPATSHQRSATLHQFLPTPEFELTTSRREYSFEQPDRTEGSFGARVLEQPISGAKSSSWTSFFHSRAAETPYQGTLRKGNDLAPGGRLASFKRITVAADDRRKVHLVKPRLISGTAVNPSHPSSTVDVAVPPSVDFAEDLDNSTTSAEITPSKRPKRTLSMSFSSAGNWVSRTSGSLRRPKRGAESRSGNKRYVSAPVSGAQYSADQDANYLEEPLSPTHMPGNQGVGPASAIYAQHSARPRNASSPLPPLSRLVGGANPASSGGVAARSTLRQNQPSGSSSSSAAMSPRRGQPFDRRSTLDGSEGEPRDFGSVDDDDTDFKSDGLFDSIRTAGSSRARAVETPLDSMYDESPPSTAGNSKTKRLSIQEILGRNWDEENKIMEEDENTQTPVRGNRARFSTDTHDGTSSARDPTRMSIDDDFDEDWANDDDAPFNSLSPPSNGGSLNAKGINPNVRLALANISGNGTLDASINDTIPDRPLSNLFDWSEPSTQDKQDDGHSPRPRTAYAKQESDPRGGRSATRKGPTPTHVRSQSVPVVHDGTEDSKPTGAKYGTWGMSSKTVSEDWDEDFEFGGSNAGEEADRQHMFAVPESIRATQPSVKAHSGQIREFSLLVNDLKRLCRHGRDMGLLEGPYKSLWKEAEGIITLASPDEDSEDGDNKSDFSMDLDEFDADDRLLRGGMDAVSLDKLDAAIDSHPAMSKTAVVRERPSPRRRSVFSPDDDIFGFNASTDNPASVKTSRPRTPEPASRKSPDVNGVVRHVMEAMQQITAPAPPQQTNTKGDRMHFDTNSLKALVKRAGDLRDTLSDAIRKVDQITQSPARTPRHDRLDRHPESSPAFTKVFEEPTSTPPRMAIKNRGNSSTVENPNQSPDNSPSSGIGKRLQMMTVS